MRNARELPKVRLKTSHGMQQFYFDERLMQLRQVDNPNVYRDLNDMEAYLVKQNIENDACEVVS